MWQTCVYNYKWSVLSQNDLSAISEIFEGHNRIIQNNTFLMIPFSIYIIKEYFWSYDQKY